MKETSPKSIYIHLPFCKTKCPYCDFASYAVGPEANQTKEIDKRYLEYIEALSREIDFRFAAYKASVKKPNIETIFFGGGTPSVHSAQEIKMILDKVHEHCDFDPNIEITLEANPGTIDKEKLESYKAIGINRISIGVQSFDRELLEKLGRGHSLEDSYQAIKDIKAVGYDSWSFDLIYGLPKQNLESWQKTVEEALSFDPPHISAYALSIEKNTPYGEIYSMKDIKGDTHPNLPSEEEVSEMYLLTNREFAKHGLERYEISNWAKPKHEAKHNLTYWRAQEYFAFGISAHGYVDGIRYSNTRDLSEYLDLAKSGDFSYKEDSSFLVSDIEKLEEEIMLKLRLREGLSLSPAIKEKIDLAKLDYFLAEGLLVENDGALKLNSSEACLVSNKIIGGLVA